MNKFKEISNLELLKELEQRITNFNQSELTVFVRLTHEYEPELMKVIQANNPRVYQWILEKRQQYEQEQTDQEIGKIKKSLEKK